jgi:N-acetylglucosamine repressor
MIQSSSFGHRLVREYNELNILRFIKNEGPISRADLAKRYKISKAAVSEIIAHLLGQEYIIETGIGSSTSLGGRKPILLEFNNKAGYVIGIEIKRDHAAVALSDLNAVIYKKTIIDFPKGTSLKTVLRMIFKVVDVYLKISWVEKARPVGIGVAIPGLINYHSGKIRESDTLKNWQGVPIKEAFEQRYNIETIVENDVKAISLGECRFGGGKNISNFVYLWIGDGLSAGIIINGELYRGVSAAAGEIGYLEPGMYISEISDFKLVYHNQKTYGDLLSEVELLKSARKVWPDKSENNLTIEKIIKLADENHNVSVELLREYGLLAGIVCIHLINTLNPDTILIGGHTLPYSKVLLKFIKDKVKHAMLKTPSNAVRIRSASLREDAGILGAVALILEDLFFIDRLNITRYKDVFGCER